jgi:hypothetical protein
MGLISTANGIEWDQQDINGNIFIIQLLHKQIISSTPKVPFWHGVCIYYGDEGVYR